MRRSRQVKANIISHRYQFIPQRGGGNTSGAPAAAAGYLHIGREHSIPFLLTADEIMKLNMLVQDEFMFKGTVEFIICYN